jgi:arylsulfatase A-like enzyme
MTMDLMPTYLELTGMEASGSQYHRTLDGKTLTPVLFEGLGMPQRDLFWRRGKEWAIRRGPWKLVGGEEGKMMLFNLDDDISEQNDLAKHRPELVEELLAAYKDWEKDMVTKGGKQ